MVGDAGSVLPSSPPPLWKNADFVRLWLAGGVSGLGARITREGLPLMAVMLLRATPAEIGMLAAIRAAPSLVVGLSCGGWVDRARRLPILIGTDLARGGMLVLVPAAAFVHHLAFAEVYLAAAGVGALSTLFDMADHAYLPTLVARATLVRANAALGASESVAEIGGPALAGVLFMLLSAPFALLVNSVTYGVSAVLLMGIGRSETVSPGGPSRAVAVDDDEESLAPGGLGLFDGVWWAWATPTIRPLLLLIVTVTLCGSIFAATYIPFALNTLRLTPALLGASIAVGGVGALAGAALAPVASRRIGIGPALIVSSLLGAAFTALIPAAGGPPWRGAAFLMTAQLLGDAAGTAMYIYVSSLRQGLLPPHVLGRVAGAFAAATGMAGIAGALGGGWLAEAIGTRGAMLIACVGLACAPIWCVASPIRATRWAAGGPEGAEARPG